MEIGEYFIIPGMIFWLIDEFFLKKKTPDFFQTAHTTRVGVGVS